ncbi:Flp family type IVb pilin [Croceicoccus hydrothermalis]|uniref:Flp family type IVb pilin n=1 Tax=Croceicoccus hydrothermalis TaxID=2867964 RepID=UPI001EFAC378|nr:Flp family type IVb pilin [Croceicoccus hydrothermalis]
MKLFHQIIKDESGATAIEYGLIAALIAVACIGALTQLGGNLTGTFEKVGTELGGDADGGGEGGADAGAEGGA